MTSSYIPPASHTTPGGRKVSAAPLLPLRRLPSKSERPIPKNENWRRHAQSGSSAPRSAPGLAGGLDGGTLRDRYGNADTNSVRGLHGRSSGTGLERRRHRDTHQEP